MHSHTYIYIYIYIYQSIYLSISLYIQEAHGSVRFGSVPRSAGSGSAGSVLFPVPAGSGSEFIGGG